VHGPRSVSSRFTGVASLLLAAAVISAPVAAAALGGQSGTNLERPPTWKARYDERDVVGRSHVVMRPGWHINPGAAGIFWDPGRFAAGNYSVSSTIFLFPPGQGDPPSRVDAPYGLLAGGANLDGPNPAYVTFLIRNDGRYQVVARTGGTARDVVPWTPHKAIAVWAEGSDGTARNVLALDVTDTTVTFFINDEPVGSTARAGLGLEGIVGLRAGDGLSLHVTDLTIGPNRR
jgi:hypothetical protein